MCSSLLCPCSLKWATAGGKGIPKTWVMISLVKHVTEKSGKNLISSRLLPRRAFLQVVPIQPDLPGRGEHTAAAGRDKSSPSTERAMFFCFFFHCRNQFYSSQHQAPEPYLPCRLEDGFFQLQPRGLVERWLPDWWVSLGGWRGSGST